ncbi:MAG: 6-phosphogluconolactonase [Acidimicrobiia bacterium]
MELRRFTGTPALSAAVGCWLDAAVAAAGAERRFVALAVGDSTLPAYRQLAPLPAGMAVVCLDELSPPPARPEAAFAARLRAVLPPTWASALAPFEGRFGDPGEVDAALADGGLAAAVCGLGPDGHVAFNQPPEGGDSPTRLVELAGANLARLGDVHPARAALTLGMATIRAAGCLALVASGEGKAAALGRLLDGPVGDDCPATHLRHHPSLTVFA